MGHTTTFAFLYLLGAKDFFQKNIKGTLSALFKDFYFSFWLELRLLAKWQNKKAFATIKSVANL